MTEHFDLIVIGAGPAGEKGAAQAAYFGKKVCLVERAPKPGGSAVNSGAISVRTLRETAVLFSGLRQKGLYGVEFQVRPDITLADFMHRERQVVEASWQLIEENLERHQVATVQGAARFTDSRTIEVTRHGQPTRTLTADVFLVATGSHPVHPPDVPFDGTVVLDSDDVLALQSIPARMVIVGGDVMGCEFASIFGALGVKVTIVDQRDRLLEDFDHDVGDTLRQQFTRHFGIQTHLGLIVAGIEVQDGLGRVTLADGTVIVAECVLCCTGRAGNTAGLGLEHAGVATNAHGFIEVDARFRTSFSHIYAAGDVVGFPSLASTSMEQARVAMCHAFDLRYKSVVSTILPFGVWAIPEVAVVGLSEGAARARDLSFVAGKALMRSNTRAQIVGQAEGFVKLIVDTTDRRILGASIVGPEACELIHVAATAMQCNGTVDTFIDAVFSFPTFSEAYKYAAYDALRQIQRRMSGLSAAAPAP